MSKNQWGQGIDNPKATAKTIADAALDAASDAAEPEWLPPVVEESELDDNPNALIDPAEPEGLDVAAYPTTDAEKLRMLATWFDHFDDWREATKRIAPGISDYRDVQNDLRRMADAIEDEARAPLDFGRLTDLRDAIIEAVQTQDGIGCITAFAAYDNFIEAEALAYIVVEAETLHALDVEVERLKAAAALRGYARHVPMCSYRPTYPDTDEATCDCGFDAVLEAYNAALKEPPT